MYHCRVLLYFVVVFLYMHGFVFVLCDLLRFLSSLLACCCFLCVFGVALPFLVLPCLFASNFCGVLGLFDPC